MRVGTSHRRPATPTRVLPTIWFDDLFSCQTRLSIEIIFSLTLAISYEVSVHVLLRSVSATRVYH
ncbi:hypothetical protein D8W73_12230 [Citrobacter amalonaticus]|nr:hypothetical protein [Citrobacter amalonaticus]